MVEPMARAVELHVREKFQRGARWRAWLLLSFVGTTTQVVYDVRTFRPSTWNTIGRKFNWPFLFFLLKYIFVDTNTVCCRMVNIFSKTKGSGLDHKFQLDFRSSFRIS